MASESLPTEFRAFAGSENGIVEKTIKGRTSLKENEVAIRITHSGVCGTDLHFTQQDTVLGHEGIGIIEHIGSAVSSFKVGERVGFGYVWGGCGECKDCKEGRYHFCQVAPREYARSDPDTGSWSSYAVVPDQVLMHVPETITSAEAAPLMCAGMTVFTPLKKYGVTKGKRVGVMGIGGLGHLAIQFASKLGAEVIVFSTSENKRSEALKFGATEFYVSSNLENVKPEKGIDYLVVTGTGLPKWDDFFPLFNHHAQILLMGFAPEQLTLPFWSFMMKEVSVHACLTATPQEFAAMLEFAAKNDVKPLVEQFSMTRAGLDEALEKLQKGTIRYRGVLVA